MVEDRDTTPSTRDILHHKRPHKFCPYCGFRNEGDVDECEQCGKDISWIRMPEHTPTVSAPKQKPKSPPKKRRIFSNRAILLIILGIVLLIALIVVLVLVTGNGDSGDATRLVNAVCLEAPCGPGVPVPRLTSTMAFERRCIHSCCVPLPAPYSVSTPQSRALPARRTDALSASPYL